MINYALQKALNKLNLYKINWLMVCSKMTLTLDIQWQKECHEDSIQAGSSCTHCDHRTSRQILTSFLLQTDPQIKLHWLRVDLLSCQADRGYTYKWWHHITAWLPSSVQSVITVSKLINTHHRQIT